MIPFIWHYGNGKFIMQVKVSDFRALRVGEKAELMKHQGLLYGNDINLNDTVMLDICHYVFHSP